MELIPVHIAVLTIADDAASADRATAQAIAERAAAVGHEVVDEEVAKDEESAIRDQLVRWISQDNIDVVIVAASVESEAASAALAPLVHQTLPGFTDLFRWLTFQEIGASAMLSAAEAAQCQSTFVFVLPAHEGAVRAAMDKLILPQLDVRTKPKNLVGQMPRLKDAAKKYADANKSQRVSAPVPVAPAPVPVAPAPVSAPAAIPAAAYAPYAPARPDTEPEAVPKPIYGEKTEGGPGLPPKLPAGAAQPVPVGVAPPVVRSKPRTANTIARKTDDPPTKEIDLANLEKQIQLSNQDGPTKKIDLNAKTKVVDMSAHQAKTRVVDSGRLPRVPPGADEGWSDEDLNFTPPRTSTATQSMPPPTRTPAPIGVVKSGGTSPGTPAPTSRESSRELSTPAFATPIKRAGVGTGPRPAVSTPPRGSAPSTPLATPLSARSTVATPPATPVVQPRAHSPVTNPTLPRQTANTPVTNPTLPRSEVTPLPPPPVATVESPETSGAMEISSSMTLSIEPARRAPTAPPPPPVKRAPTAPPETAEAAPEQESEVPSRPTQQPNAAELWARSMSMESMETTTPVPVPAAAVAQTVESPISNLFANQPARKRPPTPPPAHLETLGSPFAPGALPEGDFSYPIKRSGLGLLLKIVVGLGVLALGFFAFVKFYPMDDQPTQTAAATPPPPPAPAPAPVVEAPAADAPQAAPPEPIEIEQPPPPPTPAENPPPPPTPPTETAKPTSKPTTKPMTKPTTEPATKPATEPTPPPTHTETAETKPETKPESSGGDCDEVGCVISKYDRPCCAKYKPSDTFTPKNVVPEELDRAMVKAGVEKIKPRVVACGEKSSTKGTVRLAVTVDSEGNVKTVSVSESPDTSLGECVASAMRAAKFGKSVNGGEFNYPFVF